jgi:uncharacterized membrane protein YcaP (DUF421 family)
MEKEDIHLDDMKRILFGTAPPEFLLEVLVRTLIIYILSLIIVKWLGKRMSGQISVTEKAVMILIGAIISVPVQVPDRGLLQGVLLLFGILLLYNGLNWLGFKKKKIEDLTQGKAVMLVKDHVMQLESMNETKISKDQLFSVLRNKKLFSLGQVKRVYLEACGTFSVYEEAEPQAGLSLLPEDDKTIAAEEQHYFIERFSCSHCGFTISKNEFTRCRNCGADAWTNAYKAG